MVLPGTGPKLTVSTVKWFTQPSSRGGLDNFQIRQKVVWCDVRASVSGTDEQMNGRNLSTASPLFFLEAAPIQREAEQTEGGGRRG
jgi:hypothetical protein